MLGTASGDGTFKLWHAMEGTCLQTVNWECGHVNLCDFVSIKDNNKSMVISCHWNSKREFSRILVWDLEGDIGWVDGKLVSHMMHFEGFGGKIVSMDVKSTADFTLLAAGSTDGMIKVFDLESGMCLYDLADQHQVLSGTSSTVTSVKFSPNGLYLATTGLDGKIHIWEAEEGNHCFTFHAHEGKVSSVEWSPCNSKLTSVGHDCTAKIWKCNFH